MQLATELLAKLLENQQINVTFPNLNLTAPELLEASSYQALCQIREILCDNQLSDPECFEKLNVLSACLSSLAQTVGTGMILDKSLIFSLFSWTLPPYFAIMAFD